MTVHGLCNLKDKGYDCQVTIWPSKYKSNHTLSHRHKESTEGGLTFSGTEYYGVIAIKS